jgi:predicted nucleic acid-binding protein
MRELKLEDMQRGSKVFIDTNIITYHLSGHSVFGGACRNFLKGIESAEYESYVTDVVLSEVLLNYVKSELFKLRGIKPHRVVQKIKREPSLIRLVNFDAVIKLFENLRVDVLPVEYKCKELVEVISEYLLLPNDALHVATMKRYGITDIATNDPDFERVGWIKVWKP